MKLIMPNQITSPTLHYSNNVLEPPTQYSKLKPVRKWENATEYKTRHHLHFIAADTIPQAPRASACGQKASSQRMFLGSLAACWTVAASAPRRDRRQT